jgi:formate dehydrogenase
MKESGAIIHQDSTQVKRTFCRICGCFCGLNVTTDGEKIIKIEPDTTHPYSWRDFCSKAGNAGNLRDHPKRLRTPMKRVGDKYVPATYEEAIADISQRLSKIKDEHGANAIANYMGNPGGANSTGAMFQNGFMAAIGSANSFSVGSVDQNSFHVVCKEMYGSEMACLNIDVDHAKCFLFAGMNPAVSTLGWMYFNPNGWQRVLAEQKKGADLIVVDPRETPTTKKANTHVVVKPGEDWALLLGMISIICRRRWTHAQDCDEATGFETISKLAQAQSLEQLSARCGVSVEQLEDIAERFAKAETAVCVTQTGLSQNRNGCIGEWLGNVLNLITGRIDRKGGRYYQPGVLKNTIKTLNKMSPEITRRSRIGNYPAVAGAYPLAVLPDEITTPGEDQVRALIINAGNPVISGPDGNKLDAALEKLDLLVGIDFFQRESHRHAHWLIPAPHFLEREDLMAFIGVVYETPFVQLGRPVIEPLNGIKHEWEFFLDLALAMKAPFMGIRGLNTITKLSRRVAAITGNARHAFNPRWMWAGLITATGRVKWKSIANAVQGVVYGEKRYGEFRPALQTPDGKINAAPEVFVDILNSRLAEPVPETDKSYPLQIVNQRRGSMMNSWLVETNYHRKNYGEMIDINPADASTQGITDGDKVRVSSSHGSIDVVACLTDEVPPGIVSMDHGWGSRLYDPQGREAPEISGVNRNILVGGDVLDELSGAPNLNGTQVRVEPMLP